MDRDEPIISLRGVRKAFGKKVIYSGLDLDVRAGETLVVVGGSGTGKSVLLKLIDALMPPDGGTVRVGGIDLVGKDEDELRKVRRKVGFVFQGAALFDSMTVADNIAYGLEVVRDTDAAKVRARVQECLECVGLSASVANQMPSELSGGMRKRAGLARALATNPQTILYDEPTTGLDPSNTRRIDELIMDTQKKLGVTSLVITHDMSSALRIGNRIALLADQKIALITDVEQARREPPPELAAFMSGENKEAA